MANEKKLGGRFLSSLALILCGLILACGAGEILVRLATADQNNYLIEMWRYATLLKRESVDPIVGHEHIPGASARLQGVEVSINSLGMRGPEVDLASSEKKRVVIVGDSIAMGWGVPEEDTLRGQLSTRLGSNHVVMTTGVGNMNMSQMVGHWLSYSDKVRPQAVILLATPRAPTIQKPDSAGWLVRHSQLYALIVSFAEMTANAGLGEQGLVDSYRAAWAGGPGVEAMEGAMEKLKVDQEKHGYRVIVLLVPEPHSFDPYRFDFIDPIMAAEARKRGWAYINPQPVMKTEPAESYWVAPNDVHPNAKAFQVFADLLLPELNASKE